MDHMGHDLTSVLVSGASGYLGSRTLKLLMENGVGATGLGRLKPGLIHCDLTDPDDVGNIMEEHRPETIIHCAAEVPKSAEDYANTQAGANSLAMVENLLAHTPGHIVFVSSMTVYPSGIGIAREEDARPDGDGYAAAKYSAEQQLLERRDGVATILRLPGLFGSPRRSGVLFNAALAMARGELPKIDPDLPQWSALHVDDAAELMVRAASITPTASRVMNAGYPGPMSIADAVIRIALRFGVEQTVPRSKSFTFDLSRLDRHLGPLAGSFDARLDELVGWAKSVVREQAFA